VSNTYRVSRMELDGTETLVGFANDVPDVQMVMDSDRSVIDFEACYHIVNERDGQSNDKPADSGTTGD